jgi:hypothetical protein
MDSQSLPQARNRAAVEGTGVGAPYCEGYEIEQDSAALIPDTAIGRMLDVEQVCNLIRKLEREIRKQPAAASVRRPVKRGAASRK